MDIEFYTFDDKPCEHTSTCLGAKLMRLAPITVRQEKLLARLEENIREVPRGEILLREGDPVKNLMVLKRGWVMSGNEIGDGRTSISQIHHPGDVIGFENLAFETIKSTSIAASNLEVCTFPRRHLSELMAESPRLSGLLMVLAAIDQAIIADRVMISRRKDGEARLSLFLLQTISRLRLMNNSVYDQFHCPLRQQEIGDATGLTSVHVSRTLTRLEEQGYITRFRQFIRFLKEDELARTINFRNRYADLDLDWLPPE